MPEHKSRSDRNGNKTRINRCCYLYPRQRIRPLLSFDAMQNNHSTLPYAAIAKTTRTAALWQRASKSFAQYISDNVKWAEVVADNYL